jgi:DNA-3-methyladenine glycosylase I
MRCSWAESDALRAYHDDEWGRPVTDERGLFEKLCLEAFQSGLSWSTILRKRDGFRRAFAGFDPDTVAALGPNDVDRLLADPEIVRNRAKIEAVIANARAVVALRGEPRAFAGLVWSFAPEPGPPASSLADLPAATPESKALAKELKARGFRFVGPTTAYALMQACGLVNDHVTACFARDAVNAEQAEARTRTGAQAR